MGAFRKSPGTGCTLVQDVAQGHQDGTAGFLAVTELAPVSELISEYALVIGGVLFESFQILASIEIGRKRGWDSVGSRNNHNSTGSTGPLDFFKKNIGITATRAMTPSRANTCVYATMPACSLSALSMTPRA